MNLPCQCSQHRFVPLECWVLAETCSQRRSVCFTKKKSQKCKFSLSLYPQIWHSGCVVEKMWMKWKLNNLLTYWFNILLSQPNLACPCVEVDLSYVGVYYTVLSQCSSETYIPVPSYTGSPHWTPIMISVTRRAAHVHTSTCAQTIVGKYYSIPYWEI